MCVLRILLVLLLGLGISYAGPPDLGKHADEQSVSMIQLISRPESFDGRRVEVTGYLVLRDEYESSLFFDNESQRSGMTSNSIAIELEESSRAIQGRASELDRSYVVVTGIFRAGATSFSGGKLSGIYYLAPLKTQ